MSWRNRNPITARQRQCVIEATIDPLCLFPRGFARSKQGPFYNLHTVNRLVEHGWLRVIRNRAGKHHLRLSARTE